MGWPAEPLIDDPDDDEEDEPDSKRPSLHTL